MEGEALIVGIGTFAIGVAGFAAVAAGLRRDAPRRTQLHSLRVRAIVPTSLNVAFENVLSLIANWALGDPHGAVRLASVITGAYAFGVGRGVWVRGRLSRPSSWSRTSRISRGQPDPLAVVQDQAWGAASRGSSRVFRSRIAGQGGRVSLPLLR